MWTESLRYTAIVAMVPLLLACSSAPPGPAPAQKTEPAPAAKAPEPAKPAAQAPAPAQPPTAPPQAQAPAPQVAPAGLKRGGTLTVGTLSSPRQLDPHRTASADDYLHTFWMFNALTRILPDGKVVPDLAESWKSSDDLTKWTFTLRKGVLFHDGRELNAEDVVASLKRVQDPATGSIGRAQLAVIQSITAPDANTVELTLNTPYAELPKAVGAIQAKIAPKDSFGSLSEKPVGTGPFKFAELVVGDKIRVVRNDKYFVKDQPYLDEIVYRVFPEALVAATALRRGEIDIWYRVPPDQIKDLQRAGGEVVVEGAPTGSFDAVIVHNERKPFDDPKVRLALNYATDKQKVVDAAVFGFGTPVDTPIAPNSPVYKKDHTLRKQDVAKAKQLLAEAGHPDGMDITLIAPSGRPNRERLALVIQDMWKAAGIRVKVEKVPWDKFVTDVELKGDAYTSGWAGRATVDQIFQVALHSKGTYNMFHYSNPKVDQLLDEGRRAKTPEEQARLYGQVQQELLDNPPGVVAYVIDDYTSYRKSVQGYRIHPLFGVMYLDDIWVNK